MNKNSNAHGIFDTSANADKSEAKFLRVADVAQRCSVSVKTVYRWIGEGLPIHQMPGSGARGIILIAGIDLEVWLRQYRREPVPQPAKLRLSGRRLIKSANLQNLPAPGLRSSDSNAPVDDQGA